MFFSKKLISNLLPYPIDTVIFESDIAGEYTVDIIGGGKYEITCVAGGGNSWQYWPGEGQQTYAATGGSGSAFVGILHIPSGTYPIIVGGQKENSSILGITTYAGETASSFNIFAGGSAPTISLPSNVRLISTSLNSSGNNGNRGRGGDGGAPAWITNRTLSVYQPDIFRNETHSGPRGSHTFTNTNYGYGAGSGCYSQEYTRVNMPAMGGYVKITYLG